MLVLSRKPNESIIINDNIVVTVVSVKEDRVRIGVTAPNNVPVDREEVHIRRNANQPDDDVEADLKELQGDKKATF